MEELERCKKCLCSTCKTLNTKFGTLCRWFECEGSCFSEEDIRTKCEGYTNK